MENLPSVAGGAFCLLHLGVFEGLSNFPLESVGLLCTEQRIQDLPSAEVLLSLVLGANALIKV